MGHISVYFDPAYFRQLVCQGRCLRRAEHYELWDHQGKLWLVIYSGLGIRIVR
jgi:hypothetical protein